MKTSIEFFGQLTDITSTNLLEISGVADTDSLLQQLYLQFPELRSAKFMLAVNHEQVHENTLLKENNKVALMPPFSGG